MLHGQPTPKTTHPEKQSHRTATRLSDRFVGWRSRPQSGLGCSSWTCWRDHPPRAPKWPLHQTWHQSRIWRAWHHHTHPSQQHEPLCLVNSWLSWSWPSSSISQVIYLQKGPVYLPKKRKLGEERRLAAKAEADKLLSARFIEEAHYTTWLSNVVLVKKANDKW